MTGRLTRYCENGGCVFVTGTSSTNHVSNRMKYASRNAAAAATESATT